MANQKDITDLLTKVSTGKATASEKIKLAELLNSSAKEEAVQEFNEKITKVKEFIEKQGLSVSDVLQALKSPAVLIFRWTDKSGLVHERHEGEKGKLPSWVAEMVKTISKDEALKAVVGNSEKGKTFVENAYKPK